MSAISFSRYCCRCLRWVRRDTPGRWGTSPSGEWVCPLCNEDRK